MSSRRPVRVCVVGCGHWGKNLVRNMHQLGALHAVCDSDTQKLAALATQYSGVKTYTRLEDALASPDIDAMVFATPAEQHYQGAMAAIEAGKDIFVEKPLTLRWQDGERMVQEAKRNNRILMVGHLLIYHPAIRKIKELLDSGDLGKLEYVYSNRLSMGKVRREENALWSFAPHDVSVLLLLTGHLPLEVTAVGGTYLQPNIADVTVSNLLFNGGTRAHIFVSWLHPYKEQKLVVIGSKRMVVFNDSIPANKLVLYDKQVEWGEAGIKLSGSDMIPVQYDSAEPLGLECAHFLECVAERKRPDTPGEEAVDVLKVLEACQLSLELNGKNVQLAAEAGKLVSF